MNNKLKKVLASIFVLTLVAAPLYGCGGDKASSSSKVEENPVKVTLNRKMYLIGESLDVQKVEVYREALGFYNTVSNYTVANDGWNQSAGHKKVTISAGSEKATVEVDVYESAAAAAEANSIYDENGDMSKYFDETKVINLNRNTLRKETILGEDKDGAPLLRSFVGSKTTSSLNKEGAGPVDIWTADSSNPNRSILQYELHPEIPGNERAFTTPHTRVHKVDVLDDKGEKTGEESWKWMFASYDAAQWRTEMIFDKDGKIAYMAFCMPDNSWTAAAGHPHTTRWYSHSEFAETKVKNPALLFEEDETNVQTLVSRMYEPVTFDVTQEDSNGFADKYFYEKIIPEGGFYMILTNQEASTVWQWWTGDETQSIDDDHAASICTQAQRDKGADEYRGILDPGSKRANFYAPSTLQQQYAYWYLEIIKGSEEHATEYAEVAETRKEIYKLLVEAANPVVEEEPVLKDYYDTTVQAKIKTWANAVQDIQESLAA